LAWLLKFKNLASFYNYVCYTLLFCIVRVCLHTGRFVMVPLNLTCLHCLQHIFFEHIFSLYFNCCMPHILSYFLDDNVASYIRTCMQRTRNKPYSLFHLQLYSRRVYNFLLWCTVMCSRQASFVLERYFRFEVSLPSILCMGMEMGTIRVSGGSDIIT